MRIVFRQRIAAQIDFGLIYGTIALVVLCASRYLPLLNLVPSCAFKEHTGIPCPTCGSTRSIVYLSHGDFLAALMMNPLTALCLSGAVLLFLYDLVTVVFDVPRVSVSLTRREGNALRACIIALLITQWIYLILKL